MVRQRITCLGLVSRSWCQISTNHKARLRFRTRKSSFTLQLPCEYLPPCASAYWPFRRPIRLQHRGTKAGRVRRSRLARYSGLMFRDVNWLERNYLWTWFKQNRHSVSTRITVKIMKYSRDVSNTILEGNHFGSNKNSHMQSILTLWLHNYTLELYVFFFVLVYKRGL